MESPLMPRRMNVQKRHRPSRRLDLHIDAAVVFLGFANVQRHVDEMTDVPIGPIAGGDLDAGGTRALGVEADALQREVLGDVLRAGFPIKHFNRHRTAKVIAAETVEVFNPLIFGNRSRVHGSPAFGYAAARVRAAFRAAALRPAAPLVRTAFRAAADREEALRRAAAECACLASARCEAALRLSCFRTPRIARERLAD